MSVTNWKEHVSVWLCDKDRKPTHRIDKDLERPVLNVAAFGRGHFAFEIDAESIYATEIDAKSDEEQYIAWQRRDRLVSGVIQRVDKRYAVQDGKIRTKIQVSGKLAGVMAWFPIMQPDSGGENVSFAGKVDDAMKDHAQYQMVVGDAYADPDSNARGYAGVSVAADKTEHPDTKTLTRSGACLGDELLKWGVEYDVDWDLETTWAVGGLTWQFQTWYQGRGSDLTIGNSDGNVPVILSDIYEVVGEASCYVDRYGFRTHGYNEDLSSVVARSGVSGFMRREVVVKATAAADVTLALQRYDQAVGQTFLFIESDGIWAGREFWIYDKVTHGIKRLSTDYEDNYVAEIEFSYDPKGNETIKLVLGDPKPDLSKTPGSRRADTETEEPWHGGFWRRDVATAKLRPAYSVDGSPDDVTINWGGELALYSGAVGTGLTARIQAATGNLWMATTARTRFGGVAAPGYLWPAADGAAGSVLSTNGSATLTWVAAGAPPATPWTDTGAILHPTAARDVWGQAAGATWKLISATGSGELAKDADVASYLGRAVIGGLADVAMFAHFHQYTAAGAALRQSAAGHTYLNAADTKSIWFRVNNANRMVMNATALLLYSGQDLELHSGAGGSAVIKLDGTLGDLWITRNADFDGTLNIQGAVTFQSTLNCAGNADFGAGVDVTGNITVTGFVDMVDVAGHTHDVTGDTGPTAPALSGSTDNWVVVSGHTTYTQSIWTSGGGSNDIEIYCKVGGGAAQWLTLYIQNEWHKHALAGGIADAAVASHTHADGTLATDGPLNP